MASIWNPTISLEVSQNFNIDLTDNCSSGIATKGVPNAPEIVVFKDSLA